MHPLVNIAVKAARRAGDIIVRSLDNLEAVNVSTKSSNDLVSEIDVKAEQAIIDTIQYAYPNHTIMAEESGYKEFSDAEEYVWIIDPLDGTANYLHGFPQFSISIAVQTKNRIEHGVVFDPLRQECFTASRGRGAQLNERRIRVSKLIHLQNALLTTGFPFRNKELTASYFQNLQDIFLKCSDIRRSGSAALDLAYVAAGRVDGYWEFALQPWDIAAGSLLVKEAGGLVSDTTGAENYLKNGNIVAGNPKIFKALLQQLQPLV